MKHKALLFRIKLTMKTFPSRSERKTSLNYLLNYSIQKELMICTSLGAMLLWGPFCERKHSIAVYYGLLSARPNIFLTFFFKIPSLSFKQYIQYTWKLLYTNEKCSYYTLLNLWRIFFPEPKFLRRSIHFE